MDHPTHVVVPLLAAALAATPAPASADPPAAAMPSEPLAPASADPPAPVAPAQAQLRFAKQQQTLSTLWVFATLNYLYCDVVGLMDSKMLKQYAEGRVAGFDITEDFLLGATLLMQVPLSMVFLSTALPPRAARVANIAAGAFMTAAQTATLFLERPTKYYALSSGIEIATTGFITAYALFAMKPPRVVPSVDVRPDATTVSLGLRF